MTEGTAAIRDARSALVTRQRELAAELRRVEQAITSLDSVLGQGQPKVRPTSGTRASGIKNRIEQILREHRAEPMHADAVLDILQQEGVSLSAKDPKATVVTALIRMSKAREESGQTEGIYALGRNMFVWEERYRGIPSPASEREMYAPRMAWPDPTSEESAPPAEASAAALPSN